MNKAKKLFFFTVISSIALNAQAFDSFMNIKAPPVSILQFSSTSLSPAKSENYSDEVEVQSVHGRVQVPVYDSETTRHTLSGEYQHVGIMQTNKKANSPIPGNLDNIQLGHQYLYKKEPTKIYGLQTEVNSASDKPYSNWGVTNLVLTGMYYYDENVQSSWMYFVNYSSQRYFLPNVPLPGVSYIYHQNSKVTYILGLPVLGVMWFPMPKMSYNLFALGPWMVKSKLSYFIYDKTQVYLQFSYEPQSFHLREDSHEKEKLFMTDRKTILGLQTPISSTLSLNVFGGYSFGRRIFRATSLYQKKDWEEVIHSQSFINLELGARF